MVSKQNGKKKRLVLCVNILLYSTTYPRNVTFLGLNTNLFVLRSTAGVVKSVTHTEVKRCQLLVRGQHMTHPDKTAVMAGVLQEDRVFTCAHPFVHKRVHQNIHAHTVWRRRIWCKQNETGPRLLDTPHSIKMEERENETWIYPLF